MPRSVPNSSTPATGGRTSRIFIAAALAVAACALLFPIPHPAIRVNQPFKVEFLIAFCLIIFLIVCVRSHRSILDAADQITARIAVFLGAFIVWSMVSAAWASSIEGVSHHSLLWAAYLMIFLIFSGQMRRDASIRLPLNVFVMISLLLGVVCAVDFVLTPDFAINEGPLRIRYGRYAELLVTLLPLVWIALLYSRQTKHKLILAAAAALGWLTVMLSLSKGAFIAGIIGFVVFFLGSLVFSPRIFRKPIVITAGAWFVFTAGAQLFFTVLSPVPSTADYITGAADETRSTTAMRRFTWSVAREMAAQHLLNGVGADNFGLAFNEARKGYRLRNPEIPASEVADDYLVERAHNEPLQVLAELGIVGLLLFAGPYAIFVFVFVKKLVRDGFRISPIAWAAAGGMTAFAISSLFSSFSFRSAQNGAVFFIVMAIAVRQLAKPVRERPRAGKFAFPTAAYLMTWVIAAALGAFCYSRAAAEYYEYRAEGAETFAAAESNYRSTIAHDPEYAGAYLSHAYRAAQEKAYTRSAVLFRYAVANGIGTTPTYAALAKQQLLARDFAGADAAYREGLAIYPRSVFLRISYTIFLEDQNRESDAAEQRKAAAAIEPAQANGWYELIRNGSMSAYLRSRTDPSVTPPAKLHPESAVRQFLDRMPGLR